MNRGGTETTEDQVVAMRYLVQMKRPCCNRIALVR